MVVEIRNVLDKVLIDFGKLFQRIGAVGYMNGYD